MDVEDRRRRRPLDHISSRLNYMDFSEETTARFNEVAHAMGDRPLASRGGRQSKDTRPPPPPPLEV